MHAPHTSTSDHVVLSSRPLHPPPPLMWDTLESRENSPRERKRVDLRSSLGRGLPLIPVASRAPLWPPTVAFNHPLHHPPPGPSNIPLPTSIRTILILAIVEGHYSSGCVHCSLDLLLHLERHKCRLSELHSTLASFHQVAIWNVAPTLWSSGLQRSISCLTQVVPQQVLAYVLGSVEWDFLEAITSTLQARHGSKPTFDQQELCSLRR